MPYILHMARKPLILVSPSIEKRGVEFHDLSASLSVKYDFAVLQAGGIPVTVPATTDRAVLAECVRRVEGVMLTGGDDINSELYDVKLPAKIKKTVEQTPDGGARDLRELILIEEVFRQRKPLLGMVLTTSRGNCISSTMRFFDIGKPFLSPVIKSILIYCLSKDRASLSSGPKIFMTLPSAE